MYHSSAEDAKHELLERDERFVDDSKHLLERDERAERVAKAAWQLEDAIKGRLVKDYPCDIHARKLHFEAAEADINFKRGLWVLIVLSVFETPTWCLHGEKETNFFTYMDPSERCSLNGVDTLLLSDVPYIPPGVGVIIELFIVLFIISRKLFLDRQLQTWYFAALRVDYSKLWVVHFGLAMALIGFLDCIVFVVFRTRFRMAFLARTGYLIILPQVQDLFGCIMAVISEFLSIATFLFGTIIFFGMIAVDIFETMNDKIVVAPYMKNNGKITEAESLGPINGGFEGFGATIYTMFVAGNTDEFVNVLVPTYTQLRWTGLLWFVFLTIVHVLLLNLVLDTLVSAYMQHKEEGDETSVEEKTDGIVDAFETLMEATTEQKEDGDETSVEEDQEISRDTFFEFIREFSRSPCVRSISEEESEIIFGAVDKDGSLSIDKEEFFRICAVVEYDFWTTPMYSPVKEHMPSLWNSRLLTKLRSWVEHPQEDESEEGGDKTERDATKKKKEEKNDETPFEQFMNYVLLSNLLLVVVEGALDLRNVPEWHVLSYLELIFSFFYVTEVGIVLSVYSFAYYWSSRSNQFDFIVTLLLLISSIADMGAGNFAFLKKYMNILRLLRLLRVIKQLKQLGAMQRMVRTISCLVLESKYIFTLLGIVVFFFTSLGVQLWGGLLYEGNPSLEETEYEEKHFFVFNFNDFLMSFGVWVVSLLCEYVPCFADAIQHAAPGGSSIVFFIFYVCGVSIVFELVKAFTIEVFLDLYNVEEEEEEENKYLPMYIEGHQILFPIEEPHDNVASPRRKPREWVLDPRELQRFYGDGDGCRQGVSYRSEMEMHAEQDSSFACWGTTLKGTCNGEWLEVQEEDEEDIERTFKQIRKDFNKNVDQDGNPQAMELWFRGGGNAETQKKLVAALKERDEKLKEEAEEEEHEEHAPALVW
jgi:hypothetical protein